MSLEELVKPQDTPVTVGVMQNGEIRAPVYIVDFGHECAPLHAMMLRYKNIALNIEPSSNGYIYYVTSNARLLSNLSRCSPNLPATAHPSLVRAWR